MSEALRVIQWVTNAVPLVVAAEPGVKTLADLPVVTGRVRG
jgi:hypothetical protein